MEERTGGEEKLNSIVKPQQLPKKNSKLHTENGLPPGYRKGFFTDSYPRITNLNFLKGDYISLPLEEFVDNSHQSAVISRQKEMEERTGGEEKPPSFTLQTPPSTLGTPEPQMCLSYLLNQMRNGNPLGLNIKKLVYDYNSVALKGWEWRPTADEVKRMNRGEDPRPKEPHPLNEKLNTNEALQTENELPSYFPDEEVNGEEISNNSQVSMANKLSLADSYKGISNLELLEGEDISPVEKRSNLEFGDNAELGTDNLIEPMFTSENENKNFSKPKGQNKSGLELPKGSLSPVETNAGGGSQQQTGNFNLSIETVVDEMPNSPTFHKQFEEEMEKLVDEMGTIIAADMR
jgi:hypothetical protein